MEQPVQCLAWDVAQHKGLCILLCAFCVPSVFWRDSLVFEKFSKCTCWVECNTGTCNFAPLFFVAQVPNVAADASRVPKGCTRHVRGLCGGHNFGLRFGTGLMDAKSRLPCLQYTCKLCVRLLVFDKAVFSLLPPFFC